MNKMKSQNKILLLILALLFGSVITAQQTEAWSSLDSNAIMIGDQVNYEIGITVPESIIVEWPLLIDTITSNIEIISSGKLDTAYTDVGISMKQQFVITSFDSGYFEIPPTNFKFRSR